MRAARTRDNKGFARRPQEFLGWEVGGWAGVPGLGGERPYVAIPAFGVIWGGVGGCARAGRACQNKGFARRPQEFQQVRAGVRAGEWEWEWRARRPRAK